MKISAVAACRNSFSFLSDHGVCHTHLFYIQSRIPSLAMSVVMFVSELLSGTFPSDVFLKTCQGWRFTLKMVRHQKGPFLIRAILIILEKKKKKNLLWLVGLKSKPKSPSPCYAQWHPTPLKPNYIFLL